MQGLQDILLHAFKTFQMSTSSKSELRADTHSSQQWKCDANLLQYLFCKFEHFANLSFMVSSYVNACNSELHETVVWVQVSETKPVDKAWIIKAGVCTAGVTWVLDYIVLSLCYMGISKSDLFVYETNEISSLLNPVLLPLTLNRCP
jgi:hypothetical protein